MSREKPRESSELEGDAPGWRTEMSEAAVD
jgi:hypothetical protein